MKRNIFKRFLFLLYVCGFITIGYLLWRGLPYYRLPLQERPHSPLHAVLKPGGIDGHGVGIVGSAMILLLFLYSARKRGLFGLRLGRPSRWLDIHIFFGIMGPLLITLHTSMKFSGIVSISYFSMLAVMLSGIIGRYIYIQIPRNAAGDMLTLKEINARDQYISQVLIERFKVPVEVLKKIHDLSGARLAQKTGGVASVATILKNDLQRPFRIWQLRRLIRAPGHNIPPKAMREIVRLARQKMLLMRRRGFLETVHKVFHYWHVIHKPFAYVMIIIMFIHIIITVTFGYRWIF